MKPFRFAYLLFNPDEITLVERNTSSARSSIRVQMKNREDVFIRAIDEVGAEKMLQEFHNAWLIASGFPPNQ